MPRTPREVEREPRLRRAAGTASTTAETGRDLGRGLSRNVLGTAFCFLERDCTQIFGQSAYEYKPDHVYAVLPF
jgi:hypothetical protein